MSNDAPILPEDPAVLKAMIAALQAENAKMAATIRAHDQLIQTLRLRIAKLKKQAFGKSSEKIEREIEQLELALEDLLIASAESVTTPADEDAADTVLEVTTGGIDEGRPRRRPRVSATTPRERRELDPGSCCPDCGGDLRFVGEDMSEMLDLVAAQLKVLQIARLKKSCRRCEKMVQAPAPSRPIPGSMASAALLAWILVSKFDDHLPLYRQTEIFARMGADRPAVSCRPMDTRATPNFTNPIPTARPACRRRHAGRICGATSMTNGTGRNPPSRARRSTASARSTTSSTRSTGSPPRSVSPRARSTAR